MASTAAMTLDSDNEFDYDFDAEEEELLFQLASGNDHTPQNNARLAAIDAVPERTDRVFDQDDLSTIGASEYTLGRTETGQSSDLYRGQAFNQRESSSGLQTPPVAASNEDVYYPDCT
jgi:exonuclease V